MRFLSVMLFSILVLLTPFIDGQSAANFEHSANRVLVAGDPPLTETTVNNLTELFEWGLDGHFTFDQRNTLVQVLTTEWQSGNRSAVDDTVKLAGMGAELQNLSPEQRQQIQPKVQALLIDAIRNNPDDPVSILLVSVFQSNRSASPGLIATAGERNSIGGRKGEEPAGQVPPAVVGTWQAGTTSSVMFTNPSTGAYSDPSGTQVMYRIFADGHYEYASLTQQSMYNCTTKLSTWKTGRIETSESQIRFKPAESKFSSRDNCNAKYNYEKTAGFDVETYNWRVERDEYGEKLCLQNDKVNGCAYRR